MLKSKAKKYYFLLAIIICLAGFFAFYQTGLAQDTFGTGYGANVGLSTTDIRISVINVIRTLLGILGIIALILIIYGGFVWMTAGGNPQKIEQAKKILTSTVIGLIIIFMAFAIVQYIFKVLSGDGGTGGPQSCSPPNACIACNWWCNNGGTRQYLATPGNQCDTEALCSGPLPSSEFIIRDVQTSHAGPTDKDDVYLCSKVQSVFNANVDQNTVDSSQQSDDLKVALSTASHNNPGLDGSWERGGNIVSYLPPPDPTDPTGSTYLFVNASSDHEKHFPTSLTDTAGLALSSCSLQAGCEGTPTMGAGDFRWDFYVGNLADTENPKIVSTYPDSSDPTNIDTNVSRDVVIDVTFNENVDAASVIQTDTNGIDRPYSGHIHLVNLDNGVQVNNSQMIAEIKPNGFRFYPEDFLDAFTNYQVTIQDIADLCGNLMDPNPYTWQFATNDRLPGVSSWYPQGDNVCPDTIITVTFNTQMYNNEVAIRINNGQFYYYLPPASSLPFGSVSVSDGNGTFRIVDTVSDPSDPVDNHYRVFEFIPANNLDENNYVEIFTDKRINTQGDYLYHDWDFTVTDLANCVCSPYISNLSKYRGPTGDCITIYGQCFKGTAQNQAAIINNGAGNTGIRFDNISAFVPDIAEYTNNLVGTIVPAGLNIDTTEEQVTVEIAYSSGGTVPRSNQVGFLTTTGTANGPCLWSVNPSHGRRGDTISLSGIRFGGYGATHRIDFAYDPINGPATYLVPQASDWTDTRVTGVIVPGTTEDGEVTLTNDIGESNGIPFDVRYCGDSTVDPGEECDRLNLNNRDCTDFGYVGGDLLCANNCQFNLPGDCSNAPRVIETSACDMACTGGANDSSTCYNDSDCPGGVCLITSPPSPNPYRNQTDVCLNAFMTARFNTDIDSATINSTNIYLARCANDDCSGTITSSPSTVVPSGTRSFELRPTGNLDPNTTYQVTITTGIASTAGINMEQNYQWHFATRDGTDLCDLESVYVDPHDNTLGANATYYPYHSSAIGPRCTVINGISYDWIWTVEDSNPTPIGVGVTEDAADDTNATVTTAGTEGTVYIRAATGGEYNQGRLTVAIDSCVFNPSVCPDPNQDGIEECPMSECDLTIDRCTPIINDFSPVSGAIGTWVTIAGCHFGSSRGQVIFTQNRSGLELPSYCDNTWTNTQIIVEVPDLSTASDPGDDATTGPFAVITADGLSISTNDINSTSLWLNPDYFEVNLVEHPGLCLLRPDNGIPDTLVSLRGQNFGAVYGANDQVVFSNNLEADINLDLNNDPIWGEDRVEAITPVGVQTGNVYLVNDTVESNGLNFTANSFQGVGTPCDGDTNTPNVCDVSNDICTDINENLFCDSASVCTCQAVPPTVESHDPTRNETNVCRNALITATFDQAMNRNTINNDTFYLESVGSGNCPVLANTKKSLWSKIITFFNNIFFTAKAQTTVSGRVWSRNVNGQTETVFIPDELLDQCIVYQVTVVGGNSGVKSVLGGQMANDYAWPFTTSNDVCDIDHVDVDININTENGEITKQAVNYDYFTCAGRDDCNDDVSTNGGNQHLYQAWAKDNQGTRLMADYTWQANEPAGQDLINLPVNIDTQDIEVTANPYDGQSTVIVTAFDPDDTDDYNYGTSTEAVTVVNFICQNPWPSLTAFPFEDSANNCTIGSSDCSYDMDFFVYYCRDYGEMEDYCVGGDRDGLNCNCGDGYCNLGTNTCISTDDRNGETCCPSQAGNAECVSSATDDLPALENPPNIKGVADGVCIGGSLNGSACNDDSNCLGGFCRHSLKEFMFFFDDDPNNNINWCTNSLTPCEIDDDCPKEKTCDQNNDVIGIRVYNNGEHLSPAAWHQKYFSGSGTYPASPKVDGYEAISSGRDTYINAAVVDGNNIYTNIFHTSYSVEKSAGEGEKPSDPVTAEVSKRFYQNLTFNISLPQNLRLCTGSSDYCTRDSDCESGQTCQAPKDKLARDVIRVGTLGEMIYHLDLYRGYCSNHNNLACLDDTDCPDEVDGEICIPYHDTYPTLEAGTYLAGQSVSLWDSWNRTFASELGTSLLLDPLNQGIDCPDDEYNQECWDEEANANNFKCEPGSHMYHYVSGFCANGSICNDDDDCGGAIGSCQFGNDYNIYMNMEYANSGWQPPLPGISTGFVQPCLDGTYDLRYSPPN